MYTGFWWENLREGDHVKDSGVDGGIILRWIFRKWDGGHGWALSFEVMCQICTQF